MRNLLYKLFAIFIVMISLVVGWIGWDYQVFLQTPLKFGSQGLDYQVDPGVNLTQVVSDLSQRGILEHPRYLLWHARWSGNANRIKVGEYHFAKDTTPVKFVTQLSVGKVVQYALTLVEGRSFHQIMDAVNKNEFLSHSLQGLSAKEIMLQLGYPNVHPEGRFFPDTYNFPKGTSDIDFLRRAYRAMEQQLEQAWHERDAGLPFKTPYEALILASIVEKETALPHERSAIAGVFVRRLQRKMRLQSDPTVIYGLGKNYDGNIRRADLSRETPYNTYRRFGLPPTPIAMSGYEAIYAALHPQDGNSLYFVSRGDGSHQFSETLKEHNAAVIRYQLKGRKRAFSTYNPNNL